MTTHIPAELRRFVAIRAGHQCEYCRILEADTFLGCQIDHVIAEKHGGDTDSNNLAYSCVFCNRFKGTDLGSLSTNGELIRFFNPRTDQWNEHFAWSGHTIVTLTEIGDVTSRILRFNSPERILERESL